MHEMSLCLNLIDIIRQEMEKHGATRLLKVRVKHGQLANVVPEAMEFAFEACIRDTDMDGAELELEEVPLVLACSACGKEFTPEDENVLCTPCPECGEDFGHRVVSGKELYLDFLEAE
jgi:hydrogenase nickel incorporation protein HypA/HybF